MNKPTATPTVPAAPNRDIKIIVNDHAITTLDIQGRAKLLQLANHLAPGPAVKAAQDELIDEALRIDDAKKRGLDIPDRAVDDAVADLGDAK